VPEGDTIHRAARALDRALAGRRLLRFEAPRLGNRPFPEGTRVLGAEARGKHCLINFDDGRTLRTHMQMTGSWHLYRPGERWRKKPASARVWLEVAAAEDGSGHEGWVAVCFAAPVVELEDQPQVDHLGPDLCRPDADVDEATRRMGELSPPDRTIGEALLDQRVAAGIGNIYKNEACFACGVDPWTPVGQLREDERRRLLETAGRQLRANLDNLDRDFGGPPGSGPAVYGKRDRPCRRCGTTIRWAPQGDQRRGTYWCPTCQPARPVPA
jgi:endonuclease VIII